MKRVLAMGAAITLSAMLAGAATAQEADKPDSPPREGQGEGGRPDRERMREEMLKRFDEDKDGKLSDEEREKARAARRGRIGREGGPGEGRGPEGRRGPDGHGGPGGPPARRFPDPMRLFDNFDEDKNEQLSKAEFEKLMARVREMMPPPPRPGSPPRFGGPDGPGHGPGFGEGRRHGPGPGGPDGRGPRGDGERGREGRRPRGENGEGRRRPEAERSEDKEDAPATEAAAKPGEEPTVDNSTT